MERYNRIQEIIEASISPSYSSELLGIILAKSNAKMDLQVGIRDSSSTITSDLEYYNNRYESMNNDVYRNNFFRAAIAKFSQRYNKWLEIGPGADGYLTKIVLTANPQNNVTAVEGSSAACRKILKKLETFIRKGRLRVYEGLAGTIDLGEKHEVLLAELLGHWGSSEGYVEVLRQCGLKYHPFDDAIPRYFGTFIVPVDLTRARYLVPTMVGNKAILFRGFPFEDTKIGEPQIMEHYSTLETLKRKYNTVPVHQDVSWKIGEERTFCGFSTYLFYGNSTKQESWSTSITSKENPANNWCHILIPVGPIHVLPGTTIRCQCICDVFQREPSYRFIVDTSTGFHGDYAMDYQDLYQAIVLT